MVCIQYSPFQLVLGFGVLPSPPHPPAGAAHCSAVQVHCATILGSQMRSSCESVVLQYGDSAQECAVPFQSVPLCVFLVCLQRGTPKFSSLRHSEGITTVAVHHFLDFYVAVDFMVIN